jgi:hypothetical protein
MDVLLGCSSLAYGGGMAVACKNGISPTVLAYEWHGGTDVLIAPSILAYGWRRGQVKKLYKSIHSDLWGGMELVMF